MCTLIAKFSSQAHELMLQFHLDLLGHCHCEVLPQTGQAQRAARSSGIMPQGPGEGSLALGEFEALEGGVQVRSTSRRGATRIRYDGPRRAVRVRSCDHPQQLTLGGPLATSDARPDRAGGSVVTWGHQRRV